MHILVNRVHDCDRRQKTDHATEKWPITPNNVQREVLLTRKAIGLRWSPFPKALSQTPVFTLRDHGYEASASRGVPVHVAAFTGTHYSVYGEIALQGRPAWWRRQAWCWMTCSGIASDCVEFKRLSLLPLTASTPPTPSRRETSSRCEVQYIVRVRLK